MWGTALKPVNETSIWVREIVKWRGVCLARSQLDSMCSTPHGPPDPTRSGPQTTTEYVQIRSRSQVLSLPLSPIYAVISFRKYISLPLFKKKKKNKTEQDSHCMTGAISPTSCYQVQVKADVAWPVLRKKSTPAVLFTMDTDTELPDTLTNPFPLPKTPRHTLLMAH